MHCRYHLMHWDSQEDSSDTSMGYLLNAVVWLNCLVAYLVLRLCWFVRRPATDGACVALWHKDKVLLLRTRYRTCLSLPGSVIKPGESSREAARRGLMNDLGIGLAVEGLELAWQGTLRFESRLGTTDIWEIRLESPPPIRSHGRRIAWAGWMPPSEALKKRLSPPVWLYLARTHGGDVGQIVDWSLARRKRAMCAVK